MVRIWGQLKIKEKIAKDAVEVYDGATPPDIHDVVDALCHTLDIPRPVVLSKHEREYDQFARTIFTPADFIEQISYHRFEVEVLKDKTKRRR
ncbi:MAG: hypothetical protein PHO66_07135 [Eubacteriales bacterium]|nr:hypothetical protein [Eubacteriales bacterium]